MPYHFDLVDDQGMPTGEYAELEWWQWPHLMTLAQEHGWRPRGTSDPMLIHADERDAWDKNYVTLCGQLIDGPDLKALGRSLESAIGDEDIFIQELAGTTMSREEAGEWLDPFLTLCRRQVPVRLV